MLYEKERKNKGFQNSKQNSETPLESEQKWKAAKMECSQKIQEIDHQQNNLGYPCSDGLIKETDLSQQDIANLTCDS